MVLAVCRSRSGWIPKSERTLSSHRRGISRRQHAPPWFFKGAPPQHIQVRGWLLVVLAVLCIPPAKGGGGLRNCGVSIYYVEGEDTERSAGACVCLDLTAPGSQGALIVVRSDSSPKIPPDDANLPDGGSSRNDEPGCQASRDVTYLQYGRATQGAIHKRITSWPPIRHQQSIHPSR
jgi:hypothetical protein